MALAGDEDDDRGSDDVSLEGRRVVVADDDPAVVWFFAGLLREAGAIAIECEDGREALDEARRKRPDVIVSDILMPRLDGLALCRELKRDPGLADAAPELAEAFEGRLPAAHARAAIGRERARFARRPAADDSLSARPAIVSRPAETPPAESGGMGLGGWALLVILFGVAGYFGWRALREPERGAPDPRASDGPAPVVTEAPSPEPAPTEVASPETRKTRKNRKKPKRRSSRSAALSRASRPTSKSPRARGFLQVEAAEGEVEVALRRRGEERLRELGGPPVSLPLDEGQYEIVFRSSAGDQVRYLFVRAGQTRVVRPDR
ncbi:MAG: response regulator [Sandaracinus sp.]|nr:response regulator [Sandaracinus sp.]